MVVYFIDGYFLTRHKASSLQLIETFVPYCNRTCNKIPFHCKLLFDTASNGVILNKLNT